MKRIIGLLICIVVFISTSSVVFAQTGLETSNDTITKEITTSPSQNKAADRISANEDKKAERIEAMKEKRADRIEAMEERKADLIENRIERIKARFSNITLRFNAAITRLENIIERANTRIEKLSTEYNVTEAQTFIDKATEHVRKAKTYFAQAETQFDAVLASENPRAIFATVKDSLKQTKDELIAARSSLREAVSVLKTLRANKNAAVPSSSSKTDDEPASVTTIAPNIESGI